MTNRNSMIFYFEWLDILEMLPIDKAMEVLRAIVDLAEKDKVTKFTDTAQRVVYDFISKQIKNGNRP